MLFPFTTGRVSPDLRFIYFVIYSTTDTFVIAFWIHDGGWAGSSSRESTRQKKKKGKECRLKNLAELIPELIPVRLF